MKQLSFDISVVENNALSQKKVVLLFKNTPQEATLLDWSNLELKLSTAPKHLLGSQADWGISQWIEYQKLLVECIEIFCTNPDADTFDMLKIWGDMSILNEIESLFELILTDVRGFKPSGNKQFFEHRGEWFMIPKTYQDAFGTVVQIARDSTFREITEALMSQTRFAQKDEFGQDLFPHAQYQTSLWILACVCRKVELGANGILKSVESVPSKATDWHDLIFSRLETFKSISLEIGVEAAFFLSNSKISLENTLITNIYTILQLSKKMLSLDQQRMSLVG